MKQLLCITVLAAVGCAAPCSTYRIAAEGGRCATQAELSAVLAKEKAEYASVAQTINPSEVAGCTSLGVVPGQNELHDGVMIAARMGANTVLLGAQTTATTGPYYDEAAVKAGLGNRPLYVTHTYVAMQAYSCMAKLPDAASK